MAANKLHRQLPQDVQDVLKRHEDDGTMGSPEYEEAVMEFYVRHLCRVCPMREEVVAMFDNIKRDPTVYHNNVRFSLPLRSQCAADRQHRNGPSEFYVIDSLKDWTITERLHRINVPTLLLNGRDDEAMDEVVEPYFEKVDKAKWVTLVESSHMPHCEERDRFMEVVSRFLKYCFDSEVGDSCRCHDKAKTDT